MRVAIVCVGAVLLVIFLGGAVNLGKAPLFGHLDSLCRTTMFMDLHYTIFSVIYRGQGTAGEGIRKTSTDINDLQNRAEFGKKQKYERLNRESQY